MNEGKTIEIIFILGTRPEAIKLAPIIIDARKRKIKCVVITTGQHPELCRSALEEFGIEIDFRIDIAKLTKNVSETTAQIIDGLANLGLHLEKQLIMVQGDTTSAFAGAYFGFLNKLDVMHLEAGLRTNQYNNPFPEEMNRRLISRLASIHFAATEQNKGNLLKEGINSTDIYVVGNSVIDALQLFYTGHNIKNEKLQILVTLHRRENHGQNMRASTQSLADVAKQFENKVDFSIIQHPNPNAWQSVNENFLAMSNVRTIPPQKYGDLIQIISETSILITDSGGLQEEATFLGIPTLIVRDETERMEAVETSICKLVGGNGNNLKSELIKLINGDKYLETLGSGSQVFGNGQTSHQVLDIIQERYLENRV